MIGNKQKYDLMQKSDNCNWNCGPQEINFVSSNQFLWHLIQTDDLKNQFYDNQSKLMVSNNQFYQLFQFYDNQSNSINANINFMTSKIAIMITNWFYETQIFNFMTQFSILKSQFYQKIRYHAKMKISNIEIWQKSEKLQYSIWHKNR